MTDTKISAFTSATSLAGTESALIVQGGANKKVSTALLRSLIAGQVFKNDGTTCQSLPCVTAPGTNNAAVANTLKAVPIFISREMAITKLGCRISATSAGATVRIGLYADAGGQPGTLVADSGDLSAAAAGAVEGTVSATVEPGLYWLVTNSSSASPTILGWVAANLENLLGYDNTGARATCLTRTFTYAAMPSDESAQTYTRSTSNPLFLWFR